MQAVGCPRYAGMRGPSESGEVDDKIAILPLRTRYISQLLLGPQLTASQL